MNPPSRRRADCRGASRARLAERVRVRERFSLAVGLMVVVILWRPQRRAGGGAGAGGDTVAARERGCRSAGWRASGSRVSNKLEKEERSAIDHTALPPPPHFCARQSVTAAPISLATPVVVFIQVQSSLFVSSIACSCYIYPSPKPVFICRRVMTESRRRSFKTCKKKSV